MNRIEKGSLSVNHDKPRFLQSLVISVRCESSFIPCMASEKSERILIVGGGVFGVSTAIELKVSLSSLCFLCPR